MTAGPVASRTLLGLPVDGRPVVREQVQALVQVAGWQLRLPEVAALGHLRRPADRDALRLWLLDEAPAAAGIVLSLDMLLYGGLVPSRFIDDSPAALAARLETLVELKRRHPGTPLFAFAATMRISNNDVAEEEKPYWATHGRLLWQWSHELDRHACTGDAEALRAATEAEAAIPEAVRADYRATRARNHALTLQALDLVAQGVIDRLVLPQDDTAAHGFNIAERRVLQQRVAAGGLSDRVLIYPGADEVLHTLCAHLVARLEQRPALRVAITASDPAGLAQMQARYEDRPVLQSVAAQVAAVGGRLVEDRREADLLLAVHTQGAVQGDWAMQIPLPAASRGPGEPWLEELAAWQRSGGALAVADLAYANGGDPLLVEALAATLPLPSLAAYAGWNTASNTLGSALAQAVLARGALDTPLHRRNLALRLAEDLLYQAVWRQVLRLGHDAVVRDGGHSPQSLCALVAALFTGPANAWLQQYGLGWGVSEVTLPWERSFEIGLRLAPTAGPEVEPSSA